MTFPSSLLSSLLAIIMLAAAGMAQAASGTWTGATSNVWQLNGNWSGASFPNASGEIATFNSLGNGNTNITLGGGSITLGNFGNNGIVFDTSNAAAYSISNGTINSFQGGNIIRLNSTVVNNQTVSASIVTDSQSILYTTQNIINFSPAAKLTLGNLSVLGAASGTGSTTYSFRGLGLIEVAGAITDNTSGGAPRLTAVANHRAGTLILSGANSFTGVVNGGDTPQSLSGGFGGTVVLDYSGGNTVLTSGSSVAPGRAGTGQLVLKGNSTGTTSLTLSSNQRLSQGYSTITVDNNGGAGTTLVLGRTWQSWNSSSAGRMVHFDLSSGGQAQVTDGVNFGFTGGAYRVDRGIIADTVNARRSVATIKGTDGKTHFATLNGSGFIVGLTSLTTLPSGSGAAGFSSNLAISSNTTRTANLDILTIRIEGASANQTLNMGGFNLNGGGAILMDGANDFTITNYGNLTPSSGVIVMGPGKLTLNGTRTSTADFDKFGPGLLEVTGNHSGSTGATLVWGGTYRASSANALTAGVLTMADSVLELGYDFTRALGTATGQVQGRRDDNGGGNNTLAASFGFSAYGADRTVNLGGSGGTVTFGVDGFVASRNAKFLLSSTTADSMVDFQNPLNLANDTQTIEVRNGSAAVDARLSGAITNGSLNKTGAGTLAVTNAGNTYASGTVVAAGTLLANNTSGSATGTGSVSVITGAVIGGNGTISPTGTNSVTVAGSLSPGSPETSGGVGTLTFTPVSGNVTHTATSTADFQLGTSGLNGLTPTYNPDGTLASVTGTATGGSDRLVFNGGSTSNKLDFSALGAGSFNITFASGYTPADKDLFDLLDWANLSGSNHASAIDGLSTSQLDLPTLSGSLLWDTSLWTSQGVLGIYVVVPEPSRVLLLTLGLAGTLTQRRRTRCSASCIH